MKTVVLVTSPRIEAPNAVAYAIRRARETGATLVAVVVLDADLTQRVAAALTNEGFVGEKVSDSVVDILSREQRTRAEALLGQIGAAAQQAGVPFDSSIEAGDASEVCARVIGARGAFLAVLVAEKRSWLTRFLSRAAAVELPSMRGCEVQVMDD
jgi:nucleotide-binding universal stress UspA family protein